MSGWLSYSGFSNFVNENWDGDSLLEDVVSNFVNVVKKWNKDVFGNILTRKRALLARLRGIQRCMKRYHFNKLIELEKELFIDLEGVLDNEELLWNKKSQSDWLSLGNRNTKYFHCR